MPNEEDYLLDTEDEDEEDEDTEEEGENWFAYTASARRIPKGACTTIRLA